MSKIGAKVIGPTVLTFCALEGYYGHKMRGYMEKDVPLQYRNRIDPRIIPSSKESIGLKTVRCIDVMLVRWAMKYVVRVRNHTHYYNINSFYNALKRPDGVGLLTVCNHVTTIDSASLVPTAIPFREALHARNCGYFNLAAEELTFYNSFIAAASSLVKLMPIKRGSGVNQTALSNFSQRAMYGDWIHMFPEGRTYQDQLKSCRNAQGCRQRPSGRMAPPGRDLAPLKWGVGKVVYDVITNGMNAKEECVFEKGVNNNRLMVLPYYHLNMEKVLPERENLSVISYWPRKGNDILVMFGEPIDVSDIISKHYDEVRVEKSSEDQQKLMYMIYKEITDRVDQELEKIEYELKDIRKKNSSTHMF